MGYMKMFPECFALFVTYNEHKTYYESLDEYFNRPVFEDVPEVWLEECAKQGECWEIQLYPRTPCSFLFVIAPSFEEAVRRLWQVCGDDCFVPVHLPYDPKTMTVEADNDNVIITPRD